MSALAAESTHPTPPPSAIPHELIDSSTAEIVQSPDTMSEGAFPCSSRDSSPGGFLNGRTQPRSRLMVTEERMSPFPLQGPIKLSLRRVEGHDDPASSNTGATTPLESHAKDAPHQSDETHHAHSTADQIEAGATTENPPPVLFPTTRAAPASPSQSPSLSRRTSSAQPVQDGEAAETAGGEVPVVDATSSGDLSSASTAATAGASGGGRTRRPSTLIPQPGKEGETIPPWLRTQNEESAKGSGVGDADGDAAGNEDGKVSRVLATPEKNTAEELHTVIQEDFKTIAITAGLSSANSNSEENIITTTTTVRQSRVVVRDFGFPAVDPRYRGAFHPIPGEFEDEDEDDEEDDDRSTASGASSGWNRFAGGSGGRVRRKSSLGGWSGFGFGGFGGLGGLARRFSKSSRRGSQAGLSTTSGAGAGEEMDSSRSTGGGTTSRRGSVQVGGGASACRSTAGDSTTTSLSAKSPGAIVLPTPLPHDTDVSLSDLTPTPDDNGEPPEQLDHRHYAFGSGGRNDSGSATGTRSRSASGAAAEENPSMPAGKIGAQQQTVLPTAGVHTEADPRLSILSQVSEEASSVISGAQSDGSASSSVGGEASKWPSDPTPTLTTNTTSSSGTTVTAREPRGRYKVLYDFEAEGEHEMSVREGEVLLIGGRWGNMGWVIAERLDTPTGADGGGDGEQRRDRQMKGLVPEGYLGRRLSE
ncbi:hypothetical protein QFC19_003723 [Naganishia cerealis]|uniref:Uncharacterized protein n=1 Tax=Naganishia cerealis TaxID=610337 RepID=A0ACC2W0L4_9TREE|nr:hypothetical protein QFC19_003723 [Naganishia cerealis]